MMKKLLILAMTLLTVLVLLVGMGAVACGGDGGATTTTPPPADGEETTTPPPTQETTTPPPTEETTTPPPTEEVEMEITSTAFEDGGTMPPTHSCVGQNISPALSWSGVPEGTQSLALIVEDSDAVEGTFTHWVIFNIPADATGLEEAIPSSAQLANGAVQGRNGFGTIGYSGPCPPSGSPHHYHFTLYALDTTLGLSGGASMTQVVNAMDGHILDQAELIGIYQR
jgi:Raf kinase inhibitor-like YbhB/YbcL family protein